MSKHKELNKEILVNIKLLLNRGVLFSRTPEQREAPPVSRTAIGGHPG